MRAITNKYTPPDGACQTHRSAYHLLREFSEDLMQHVFIENTVLFSAFDEHTLQH
jgi:regulator of cell morphogenesis and NO signaling